MTEELEQAVQSGKLTREAADILGKLAPGTFCLHKSWGFGRVVEWSFMTRQVLIDFKGRKSHPCSFNMLRKRFR